MSQGNSGVNVLRKQLAMRKVLVATVPCVFGSVYFFGWRSLASIVFCCVLATETPFLTEEEIADDIRLSCQVKVREVSAIEQFVVFDVELVSHG